MARIGNVMLCDAVYVDRTTNKAVIAGVYSGIITVTGLPAVFSGSIYAEYFPTASGSLPIEIQILINGRHVGGAKMAVANAEAGVVSMLLVPNYQFVFEEAGSLEVKLLAKGEKAAVILKKSVQLITSPTA